MDVTFIQHTLRHAGAIYNWLVLFFRNLHIFHKRYENIGNVLVISSS